MSLAQTVEQMTQRFPDVFVDSRPARPVRHLVAVRSPWDGGQVPLGALTLKPPAVEASAAGGNTVARGWELAAAGVFGAVVALGFVRLLDKAVRRA